MGFRVALAAALLVGVVTGPAAGLTPTPTATSTPPPTNTVTCAPTGTPYCADHCEPCPTVRAGCYATACGECHENPTCDAGEICEPGFGGCCACVPIGGTATATPTPTPTPLPCDGDCDGDGGISIDELVAAVSEALGRATLPSCNSSDRDRNGVVSIDELVALVRSALDGCPEELFAGVDGVYDVDGTQTDEGASFARSGLAVVRRQEDGVFIDIAFDGLETLSVSAQQLGGRTLFLGGSGVEGGDIIVSATGAAMLTRVDDGVRFTAVINVDSFISGIRHLSLTIERPVGGTPESFGGEYRLELHHDGGGIGAPFDSHVDLPITVPITGLAQCDVASDVRDDDGTVVAELGAAQCRLSPRGRFSYRTSYSGADVPLQLFGALRANGGQNAGGTFWLASFPLVREHGIWAVVSSPP